MTDACVNFIDKTFQRFIEWNECSAFNFDPIKIDVNENENDDDDDRRCNSNSNSNASFLYFFDQNKEKKKTKKRPTKFSSLEMAKPKRNTKSRWPCININKTKVTHSQKGIQVSYESRFVAMLLMCVRVCLAHSHHNNIFIFASLLCRHFCHHHVLTAAFFSTSQLR